MKFLQKNKKIISIALLFLMLLFFNTGCALVAFTAQSVQSAGFTEGSRQVLLNKELKLYRETLSWNDITSQLVFATEGFREDFKKMLLKDRSKIKQIETIVDLVDFTDNARRAEVHMTRKFYRIPVYIAEEVREKQIWVYGTVDQWKLDSIEIVEE